MPKRYYISPVDLVENGNFSRYQPRLLKYPGSVAAKIPNDPLTGIPLFNWALCIVGADSATHDQITADADNFAIPPVSLDMTVSQIPATKRQQIADKLTALGIDVSAITLQTTVRQILRFIGKHLNDDFDENVFDCSDING